MLQSAEAIKLFQMKHFLDCSVHRKYSHVTWPSASSSSSRSAFYSDSNSLRCQVSGCWAFSFIFLYSSTIIQSWRDGILVESITFNRRVVGSTPGLAFRVGPWARPLPAVACALRRETPIQYPCCSRERLWVVEDLKGRYRNGRNEWMNPASFVL